MAGGAVAVIPEGRGHLYKGRITWAIIFTAVLGSSGGLLFGYDNGVTGGVITFPDFLDRFFPEIPAEEATAHTDKYCTFDNHKLQLFTSSLYLAAAVTSLIGMYTCKKIGRKWTMFMGGICFLIGTVLVTVAYELPQLIIGRVVLGFGVGFANQSVPLYLAEMAPFRLRGAMNFGFQLCVTIGIFVAQLINYGTQNVWYGWRISLACAAAPAILFSLGTFVLPDTPNSLLERGYLEEGEKVLRRIRGVDDVTIELEDIANAVNISRAVKAPWYTIFLRRYRPQLTVCIAIPTFQQFTGINAIIFYAPQLFASLSSNAALLNTVIIGAVNVGSTIIGLNLVDRVGRKVLFIEGGIQALICEIIVGVLIAKSGDPPAQDISRATLAFVCIYIAGFAWSWGPLGWLVPSEMQPMETRTAGTAINTCWNMLMTFLIGQTFLSMLCSMKFGVFFFFAGFMVMMTLFVIFLLPETRNVPIEEMEEIRIGQHWFWSRIVAGTKPPVVLDEEFDKVEVSPSVDGLAPRLSITRGRLDPMATGPETGRTGSSFMKEFNAKPMDVEAGKP